MKNISEEEAVSSAKQGDHRAFSQLASRHYPGLLNYAFRFMKNRSEAEDVVQDALLKAYQKIDTFQGNSSFGTWLVAITRNQCLMRLKKKCPAVDEKQMEKAHTNSEWAHRTPNPDEAMSTREKGSITWGALKSLSSKDRDQIVSDQSLQTLAEKEGLSVNAVKMRIFKARKKVKGLVA